MGSTPRTTIGRRSDRSATDRKALRDVLEGGLVCHLGVVMDGSPRVLPTAYGVDFDGPHEGGTLYLHGSVAAGNLRTAMQQEVCVTVTHVDGLVFARSGFNHSMNYRSAVILGTPRVLTDPDEVDHALERVVNQACPGRWAAVRESTRKELAATAVLALPLNEASVKVRADEAHDDPPDLEADAVWAGVVPMRTVFDAPVTNSDCNHSVPEHITRRTTT